MEQENNMLNSTNFEAPTHKENLFSKHNVKIRTITNLIGVSLMFVAGLFFVLFVDLNAKLQENSGNVVSISSWLFAAIIFALGGGIFYFFGDSMKHKKVWTLILKAIGVVLSIGFTIFTFFFKNWVNTSGKVKIEYIPKTNNIAVIALIIALAGIVFLIVNYIFSIIFLDEEY